MIQNYFFICVPQQCLLNIYFPRIPKSEEFLIRVNPEFTQTTFINGLFKSLISLFKIFQTR